MTQSTSSDERTPHGEAGARQAHRHTVAVLACHSRRAVTLAGLKALVTQDRPTGARLDVVLVDDGSTAGTATLTQSSPAGASTGQKRTNCSIIVNGGTNSPSRRRDDGGAENLAGKPRRANSDPVRLRKKPRTWLEFSGYAPVKGRRCPSGDLSVLA
jgi:hypothetical protein